MTFHLNFFQIMSAIYQFASCTAALNLAFFYRYVSLVKTDLRDKFLEWRTQIVFQIIGWIFASCAVATAYITWEEREVVKVALRANTHRVFPNPHVLESPIMSLVMLIA